MASPSRISSREASGMSTRNAYGSTVSLLNDEAPLRGDWQHEDRQAHHVPSHPTQGAYEHGRSHSYNSESSGPSTPGLARANSYDSQTASDSQTSPITPPLPRYSQLPQNFGRSVYPDPTNFGDRPVYNSELPEKFHSSTIRPPFLDRAPGSFDDGSLSASANSKRYPCRFRESHSCEKTFTTSGHASRHSKIHTAEKAVACQHPNCPKKFTRADNMKQHLETHYKERSNRQPSNSHRSSISSASSKLSIPAGIRKRNDERRPTPVNTVYPHPHGPVFTPLASPISSYGCMEMNSFRQGLSMVDSASPTNPLGYLVQAADLEAAKLR